MIELIGRYVENPAIVYAIIIVLFVVIVGAALYFTPRLAAMLDKKKRENKSFYDGMLIEDPNAAKLDREEEKVEAE